MYNKNFHKKSIEPEGLPWLIASFYNYLPILMLMPAYSFIVKNLPIKNEGILLDIGTGPGVLARLIAEKYPNLQVVGIDVSSAMIKIAEKKNKGLKNLSFKTMDGKKLEFQDNSIDYVLSTFTSHHWKEPLQVFNEIHRVLKKDGIVWIYDGYPGGSDKEINSLFKFPFNLFPNFFIRKMSAFHGFSEKEYQDYRDFLIGSGNFKEVNMEPYGFFMKIKLKK